MGNQNAKVATAATRGGKLDHGDRDDATTSRTTWTAGVPSPPGQPVIELSSNRISSMEDSSTVTDEINITWEVPKDDGGFPISGYRVEMLDIQTGCWLEITFIEGYEPRCTLSNILYGIMYRFRVSAVNDAGASEPGPPSEPVVVDVPGVQIAPYFVQVLGDTIALEHEKIEFRVRALGTPKPSVQWFKDDLEIFSCDRIELREEEEGGVVILKGARLSDSGTVKCVASNSMGRAVSVAQLTIEAAPRLELPEHYVDGLVFRQDDIIRLKIPLVAKPAPRVVWFFENEPISSSGNELQIVTTEEFTSLKINSARRWHCGEFRVYAENENGEDACAVLVTVTAPPSSPSKPLVMDISETRCTLRWEASEDDGGAEVKHYTLEYYRDVWNVWLKAKTTKACQATIEDLIPGSRYKFRVRAENDYGLSSPSEESDAFDVSGVSVAAGKKTVATANKQQGEESFLDASSDPRDIAEWSSTSPSIVVEDEEEQEHAEDMERDPPAENRKRLAESRGAWLSDEQEDADILDRFLKVQQFRDLKVASMESDGLPSIAPIDETDKMSELMSELSSDNERFFHGGVETEESDEGEEDRSAQLMQSDQVEGVEDEEEDPNPVVSSMESLSSLIVPEEKKEAMDRFEQALKDMIQEAREMGEKEAMDEDGTDTGKEERYRVEQQEKQRTKKSPSVQSATESVVSVIEKTPREETEVRSQDLSEVELQKEDAEAQEFQRRVREANIGGGGGGGRRPAAADGFRGGQEEDGGQHHHQPEVVGLGSAVEVAATSRYDELVRLSSRERSLYKSPQPDASRAEAVETVGEMSARSIESPPLFNNLPTAVRHGRESPLMVGFSSRKAPTSTPTPTPTQGWAANDARAPVGLSAPPRPTEGQVPKHPPPSSSVFKPKPIEISIDPTERPPVLPDPLANPGDSVGAAAAAAAAGEPAFRLRMPANFPYWFVITYTYSIVMILILLLANMIPDGKLYINFTAFWSIVIYVLLDEDEQAGADPIETVVEGLVKKSG